MRTTILYILSAITSMITINVNAQQTSNELTNLLVQKHIISQTEADSIRAANVVKTEPTGLKNKFSILSSKQFSLGGHVQVRFLSQQESGKPDGVDIRRAYLDLKGVVTEHWGYLLQIDFANSPKILDAVVNYKYKDWLKISAGQFKIPFSGESITTTNKLETIDRSQVVEALAANGKDVIGNQNGRDIGVQISGSLLKINDRFFLDYAFGEFNGAGINVTDNNESKDFSGRIIFHPFKNFDIGGSYYNGFNKWGIPAKDQVRKRYGGEINYIYKAFDLKGEYIQGLDGITNKSGWYAQMGTFIYKKNIQLVVKYDTYDPNIATDIKNDAMTNYIFGVNIYFNEWTKLQINYTNRVEESKQINNDLIAAQLQISF